MQRGHVLGGSAAINLMTWNRATATEYDAWETSLGNPGWNWRGMLAGMKRSEHFHLDPRYNDGRPGGGLGNSGPVDTVINHFFPPQHEPWVPTLERLGVPHNVRSLGGDVIGAMYQPTPIEPGAYNRSYPANSYLPLAGPNLRVMTDTRVAKVNLAKPRGPGGLYTATGVTLSDGTVLPARREVILSAGTIQSPGLLELSGIGRKSVLAPLGIAQKINLPGVGENLQDHLRVQASFRLKPGFTSVDVFRTNATYAAEQWALRRAGRKGYLDYTGGTYAFVNFRHISAAAHTSLVQLATTLFGTGEAKTSSVIRQKLAWLKSAPQVPQLELVLADGYTGAARGYPPPSSPLFGASFVTVLVGVMHPFARGSVHVTSPDISVQPAIDPAYLSSEFDIRAAAEGLRFARQVAHTHPLRGIWEDEYEPGVDVVPPGDPLEGERWRDFVKNTTGSFFHPVGTCAMLPRGEGGVVDARLRVYGTGNLRVVDASVMPLVVSAHIQTGVYGIAERAGVMIVEDAEGRGRG